LRCHVVLTDVNAVGRRREGDINPVVDEKRDRPRRQHRLEIARFGHEPAGAADLVAQLYHGRAPVNRRLGEVDERPAARAFRIDERIKPKIDHALARFLCFAARGVIGARPPPKTQHSAGF
jgi:hypothetical protein